MAEERGGQVRGATHPVDAQVGLLNDLGKQGLDLEPGVLQVEVPLDAVHHLVGRCCIWSVHGSLSRNSSLASDRQGQLVERDRHTPVYRLLDRQLVVPVRKNRGRFLSSGDQQEQPFVQVKAHRSIWIK
jgi:hypothetical protein